MQWAIQNSHMTFAALDHNLGPLIHVLDELKIQKFSIGYIPFENKLVGLEEINPDKPTFFYGSTKVPELIYQNLNYYPGVFFSPIWFDPEYAASNRLDMLNSINIKTTVRELRENWIDEPTFIKSVEAKQLTGMVLEGYNDKSWFIEEYSHLEDDIVITKSPVHNIDREWRFFIIDGKVVAGSQYKNRGVLRIKEPIPAIVWEVARLKADGWLPCNNIVMDICQLTDGNYKIVEFNCINSSGFYNCSVKSIVESLHVNSRFS
jgi:hypothetical protein